MSGAAPERTFPPDPQGQILFGWFLLVLLVIPMVAYSGIRSFDKAVARTWPRTTAQVLESELYGRTGKSRDWCVKLSYRYVVDGRTYTSNRIGTSRVGNAGCDPQREVMEARLERLAPGSRLSIRYDPRDPGMAAVYLDAFDAIDWLFPVMAALLGWAGWRQIGRGRAARRDKAA